MQAVWYERKGPAAEVLQVGDMPRPEVGPGEVLIRVRASGINPSDTKGRGGARGNLAMPFPRIIPHQDGAGLIEAVGGGVDPARIGQRVWIHEAQLGRPFGTAAAYVTVPGHRAAPLPDHVPFEVGACLGVPALTAHRCVFADGPVEGKTVLVTGGAGAVGFYAIQFARRGGARVIATVSSDRQGEIARAAGADQVVLRSDDVVSIIGEAQVDRIVEVAFGANLAASVRLLRQNGVIATYSSDAEPEPVVPFWGLAGRDATVRFVLVYAMTAEAHAEGVAVVTRGLEEGWLTHNIAHTLPLDQIVTGHELVETGRAGGKVVLLIP